MDKFDLMAAQAHRERLKKQAGYSADDKDRVAESGAPQRDHAATTVLHVVLRGYLNGSQSAETILSHTLELLEGDGYDRTATWKRMLIMARQPRRGLKPPVPKRKKQPK